MRIVTHLIAIATLAGALAGCTADTNSADPGYTGRLEVTLTRAEPKYHLETAEGQRLQLVFPEGLTPQYVDKNGQLAAIKRGGATVEVHGAIDATGSLQVEDMRETMTSDGFGSASLPLKTGRAKVAVVMVNFENGPLQATPEEVHQAVFGEKNSLASYFKEVSFDKFTITGKVFGPYLADGFYGGEGCKDVAPATKTARSKVPGGLGAYDYIIHYVPNCVRGGEAYDDRKSSVDVGLEDFVRFAAHEVGHNLGFEHADGLKCDLDGKHVPVGGACSLEGYGDPGSPMGDGAFHYTTAQKTHAGWFTSAQTTVVSESGTYPLTPVETESGPKALRVTGGDGRAYEIEFRKGIGLDRKLASGLRDALVVRTVHENEPGTNRTSLVDVTLSDNDQTRDFKQAGLKVGKTFKDAFGRFSIKLLGIDDDGTAQVKVTVRPAPAASEGLVSFERWSASGQKVASIPTNSPPSSTGLLSALAVYPGWSSNYGVRVKSLIIPPETGDYVFWISSDDASELWLSHDETADTAERIAFNNVAVKTGFWKTRSSQKSKAIALEAGKRYRLVALMKQGTGDDSLFVGWSKPRDSTSKPAEVIAGKYLAPVRD